MRAIRFKVEEDLLVCDPHVWIRDELHVKVKGCAGTWVGTVEHGEDDVLRVTRVGANTEGARLRKVGEVCTDTAQLWIGGDTPWCYEALQQCSSGIAMSTLADGTYAVRVARVEGRPVLVEVRA